MAGDPLVYKRISAGGVNNHRAVTAESSDRAKAPHAIPLKGGGGGDRGKDTYLAQLAPHGSSRTPSGPIRPPDCRLNPTGPNVIDVHVLAGVHNSIRDRRIAQLAVGAP